MSETDPQHIQFEDETDPVKENHSIYLKGAASTEKSSGSDDEETIAAVTEGDLNYKKKQVKRNIQSNFAAFTDKLLM
jgi:hypothetical protein